MCVHVLYAYQHTHKHRKGGLMYLISVYDGKGCFISLVEATGSRQEVNELTKQLCADQGGRFFYIQDLEKAKK